jgi:anti-sigma factor RsiW
MNKLTITEDDLHAYLDGQLSAERRGEVEAYLAAHPEEKLRVDAYKAQNDALRQLFNPVVDEAVPASLLVLAEQPQAVKSNAIPQGDFLRGAVHTQKQPFLSRWSVQRIAAGLVIAVLSGAAGWLGHAQYQTTERTAQVTPLPRQAAVAHVVYSPDVRRPVEVTADQEDQLVKWLSKRLGTPVSPPKLGALGYELIGGRLLPGNTGPVAQFMYHDSSGQRLTLYVSTENASNRDTAFRFAKEGPVNVFYWVDGKFGYALSAGIDKKELARVATAVYDQLDHK